MNAINLYECYEHGEYSFTFAIVLFTALKSSER